MGQNACYAEINPYICIWCISLLTVARLADTYYNIYSANDIRYTITMGLLDFLKRGSEDVGMEAKMVYDEAEQLYKAGNYDDAVRLYEKAWSKYPDVGDFYGLLACYIHGNDASGNERRCCELACHGAEKGNSQSMYRYALFLDTGHGCAEDKAESRHWLEKSTEQGNPDAAYALASLLYDEVKTNPLLLDRCYRLTKVYADRGHEGAKRRLDEWFGPIRDDEWQGFTTARMAQRGYNWLCGKDGFQQNLALAMRCLRAAAERGDAAARSNLGWCFEKQGDYASANDCYILSASQGCTTAMLNIATNLHKGLGAPKDDAGARRYLRMAHDAGDERAKKRMAQYFPEDEVRELSAGMTAEEMNKRAWAYLKGVDNCEHDAKKAVLWFDAAASHGLVAAWYGRGVALDEQKLYSEAFASYLRGAEQGNAKCMFTVGIRYAEGKGCKHDDASAQAWLLQADEAGEPRAKGKLYELYPEVEREDKVQFMLDNMPTCIDEDFSSEEYDVEAMAHDLVNDEDYELARELLDGYFQEIDGGAQPSSCHEDLLLYLAWVYYKDGDGSDAQSPHHNLRLAHDYLMDIGDDFDAYCDDSYMKLAELYYACYTCYDDCDLKHVQRHRSRKWYGRKAYEYYSQAADEGFPMGMYYKARFLIDGDVVESDFNQAFMLLKESEEGGDAEPLYWLGNMYYYPDYGRVNKDAARDYYERYVALEEERVESEGCMSADFAQASCNLAHLLLQNHSSADDYQARQLLDRVVDSHHTVADALFGYMLYEGRGGMKIKATGLEFMRKAAANGDSMARQFLRNYGY